MGITDKEELERALHQLNSNMKKLAEVFQHNQKVFTGGFELVEMHHFVERRVLNDMFLGTVRFTDPVLEDGETADQAFAFPHSPGRRAASRIDWDWYYAEFKRCVKDDVAKGVQEFCGIELKLPEPAPEKTEEAAAPLVEHTAPEVDMVFGGDYAGQQVG
jgi:hypothetical protein